MALGPAYRDHGLVHTNAIGGPIHLSTLRDAWRRTLKATGLGRFRFHDLRHADVTLVLQQGTHRKIMSEGPGHSTAKVTLDTYSHVLPGLQVEAASRLDQLLANG
jgi:integrase